MFAGTPICPRCSKAVYAAEQTMGPGRKLYHKPCLACMLCKKRLDSFTLLEHDEQPYCKSCHLKSFGTPNLRHNNLPNSSPNSKNNSPQRTNSPPPPTTYLRSNNTGNWSQNSNTTTPSNYNNNGSNPSDLPRLRPNRSLATSPTSPTFPRNPGSPSFATTGFNRSNSGTPPIAENGNDDDTRGSLDNGQNDSDEAQDAFSSDPTSRTNTGRPGIGTIPRTVPLKHNTSRSLGSVPPSSFAGSPASGNDVFSSSPSSYNGGTPIQPLMATATGTRYGIALTGGVPSHSTGSMGMGGGVGMHMTGTATGGSPRKWGATVPSCPRCGKSVYFAEQAKAVGKTYHKVCLRCVDCGTTLDSHKLRDHDGQPYCVRCHQKQYGPAGNGYALLGKAGG